MSKVSIEVIVFEKQPLNLLFFLKREKTSTVKVMLATIHLS